MPDRPTAPTPAIDAAREWLLERANQMLVPTPRETVAFVTDTDLAALLAAREAALLGRAQRAEAERTQIIGLVQRFQPAGSPPPLSGTDLVRWILDSLREPLERAEASVAALRGLIVEIVEARGFRVDNPSYSERADRALADTAAAAEAFEQRVRAEERERCALTAINCGGGISFHIAAAIRSAPGDDRG